VLGILSVTSEWSRRTALTTFALVPRRSRTAVAKLLASGVFALLSLLGCMAAAAVATLVAGGDGAWRVTAAHLGNVALYQMLSVLLGVAFGMLFLNSALAIVLYFVLPTAWSVLGGLVSAIRAPAQWLDLSVTSGLLLEGDMTGRGWARLGTSVALWVVLPAVLGLVRLHRKEVT
jgi:ABC-2 type transport system permease protein